MQLNFSCIGFTPAQQGKRLAKRLKLLPPKDMTRDELCLKPLGLVFHPAVGGGSHSRFVPAENPPLFFHTFRPHPHPIVGAKTVENIITWLQANEII